MFAWLFRLLKIQTISPQEVEARLKAQEYVLEMQVQTTEALVRSVQILNFHVDELHQAIIERPTEDR